MMLYRKLALVPCVLLVGVAIFAIVRSVQMNGASADFDRAADIANNTEHPDPISAPILVQNIRDASAKLDDLRDQRSYALYAIAPLALTALVLFLLARKEARDARALDLA